MTGSMRMTDNNNHIIFIHQNGIPSEAVLKDHDSFIFTQK